MSDIENHNEGMQGGTRYLSFSLGTEDYAMPLLSVKEVIALTEFTPVPFSPPYFLGIMNLRGQVISVIDLRKKFNIKPQNAAETAIIICDLASLSLGIVVDSVNSVLSPEPAEVSPKPELEGTKGADFVTAVYRQENKLVLFLDVARALSVEDHKLVSKNQKAA